jgi:putative hydrolase
VINHCDNYLFKTKKAKQYNTKAITNAMRKHNIFAITHPGDKGEVDIVEIAKVAKETDTRLEINGGHGFLSVKQIEAIKSIKNKYIIGSDAHVPENVGNFDLAMKIIEEANLDVSLVENIKI